MQVLRCACRYLGCLAVYKLDLESSEHSRPLSSVLVVLKKDSIVKKHVLLLVLAERVLLGRTNLTLLVSEARLAPSVRWIEFGALQGLLPVASPRALIVNFLPTLLAESLFTFWAESMAVFLEALFTDLYPLVILGGSYILRLGGHSCRLIVLSGRCFCPAILIFLLHTVWRATGEFIS